MASFRGRGAAVQRWLFTLLVSLLVLGHACELPAFAGLIGDHLASTDDVTPAGHDHGDDEAIACDAVLALPGLGVSTPIPGLITAMVPPATVALGPRSAAALEVRPPRPSSGPPLFLLFSSFLI